MVEVFPPSVEQIRLIGKEVKGPLVYVNSVGNRKGRQVMSWKELEDFGYKFCIDSSTVIISAVEAIRKSMQTYMETGRPPDHIATNTEVRNYIEALIGLDEYYDIEEKLWGWEKATNEPTFESWFLNLDVK